LYLCFLFIFLLLSPNSYTLIGSTCSKHPCLICKCTGISFLLQLISWRFMPIRKTPFYFQFHLLSYFKKRSRIHLHILKFYILFDIIMPNLSLKQFTYNVSHLLIETYIAHWCYIWDYRNTVGLC
jgi:hypothetical protein